MTHLLVSGLFSAAESYGKTSAAMEIIIMLLVAFILGYLLRYFIGKSTRNEQEWKIKYEDERHQRELLENKLKMFETENKKLQADLQACLNKEKHSGLGIASMSAQKAAQPTQKDDLKKIEGIGPKIEKMLNEAGIHTWHDLANTEVSLIQSVLDKGGPAYKIHNPESWPFQAKLAAEGKWEELKKWQDEHKRGRF